jgi:lipoate-protein ligase A
MSLSSTWRLIRNKPAEGAWNMAVDEALFESCLNHSGSPTLRLYAWQPACLSLGFSQPFSDVNTQAVKDHGWQIVRRPTGGRAILHIDELTYSVCGLLDDPVLAGTLLESYSKISQAIQFALLLLGINTTADEKYALPSDANPKGAVCFEVPSNYEITAGGKKLVGSAQARRKNGLLQHGSLPLTGDLRRITQVLNFPDKTSKILAADRVLQRAVTTEMLTGRLISWESAALAFEQAFERVFKIDFQTSELTAEETQSADNLFQTKYTHPDWTQRH